VRRGRKTGPARARTLGGGRAQGRLSAWHPGDKLNEYLGPWDQIPEGIKQTDRDLVEQIPRILSGAGYTVVKRGD